MVAGTIAVDSIQAGELLDGWVTLNVDALVELLLVVGLLLKLTGVIRMLEGEEVKVGGVDGEILRTLREFARD